MLKNITTALIALCGLLIFISVIFHPQGFFEINIVITALAFILLVFMTIELFFVVDKKSEMKKVQALSESEKERQRLVEKTAKIVIVLIGIAVAIYLAHFNFKSDVGHSVNLPIQSQK